MVREWMLRVLEKTPKNPAREEEGTFGQDKNWFAAIASAANELMLAGTFRAALHNRVMVLVSSLLTVLLAHLDRNGGLALLAQEPKRELWLSLARASLASPLSGRLHKGAVAALTGAATAQHEVGTDAQTSARPFLSCFPSSWFVSRIIDGARHIVESLPHHEQLSALSAQYQLSILHEVGLDPTLGSPELLEDYLSDFAAMHLDWMDRIDREMQQQILKKTIQRLRGGKMTSILEVHQLFWSSERHITFCIGLLNAVPGAMAGAEKLIEVADPSELDLDLLLLVHQTLSGELQDARCHGTESYDFYREWLQRKLVVAGFAKDFLANITDERPQNADKLAKLKADAEPRAETLALFLQHVAYPLRLRSSIVTKFAIDLPNRKVRHARTLLAIIKVVERIAEEREPEIHSRLAHCGSFVEKWILDVCLRDAEATSDLEESCLRLFCSIAAGLPAKVEPQTVDGVIAGEFEPGQDSKETGIAILPNTAAHVIPRSPCLNLALLRKLIVRAEGEARQKAIRKVESLLEEVSMHAGHQDTTFGTNYAVLCEEAAADAMQRLSGPEAWPSMSLEDVFRRDSGATSPGKMLQDIGRIRWMVTQYAMEICKEPIDTQRHDAIAQKLEPLLQTKVEHLAPACRSIRIYLLKGVERARGVTCLRGLLAVPPLCDTSWVIRWRELHDLDFEKFIGAASVPTWNPFTVSEASPEYTTARTAVLEMMHSTSTAKLDKYANECSELPPAQQKSCMGGFLMALIQEPGLLSALEEKDRRPPWRQTLNTWIATTDKLPITEKERVMLRLFAGDDSLVCDNEALLPFCSSVSGSLDHTLRWRLLGHIAAVLIAAPPSSLLSTLRTLMLDCAELGNCESSVFLPGMDEDIRKRVMKALLERGENIWKFKSHWYKCACGYTFFIGECGRPMEEATCPACRVAIGGKDHKQTASTTEDDETDRSPWGYMLPLASRDDKHISFRELPSTSARIVRLLLHGAMYCGIVAHCVQPTRVFDNVVNPDSMCTMLQEDEAEYISQHFLNDFQLLMEHLSTNVEDLAASMHLLLREMSIDGAHHRDEPEAAAKDSEGSAPPWDRLNLRARNNWEGTAEAKYLSSTIKNFEAGMKDIYARWGGKGGDVKFVAELKEVTDLGDFPIHKRQAELPQLWAYRSPVTLDAVYTRLGVQRNVSDTLPVLCHVLQQPLFSVLRALGKLAGLFEWHSLVMSHFSGRITRTEAASLRVGDVLESLPPAERGRWERAFEQFTGAWHIAWPYVERFECMELSEHLKMVRVSRDSEMVWCIADSANEGICLLALTQWLVERHNELVQVVGAASKYPARKVSSRLLGQHDVVGYDKDDLMRFLRSRCVTYGVGGRLNFDFQQLEQQLRGELAKPEITVEIRAFQWLGETFAALNELKSVIKQRDLPPEVVDRLKFELAAPAVAHVCLQKVQMSISFILKSGGALSVEHAGEMLLSAYLHSVLSESRESLPSATARSEVHLCHVDALAKVLRHIINQDPMESVDPKYKVELSEELAGAVTNAKPHLPQVLRDLIGSFAEARLVETWIGPETRMIDTLLVILDDASDTSTASAAVQAHFPTSVLMKHWAAIYRALAA
eukprot:TRINITY_DN37576_c0_g1_i1.p1 TRINITY_DN37576_c0_g1~~TRINITY_DN37576_c0_g1_i1.p1  ORF type:complete len:1623 (-),score=285.47 TRINITY_DN37576_c0_g1_i1:81-4868(-)